LGCRRLWRRVDLGSGPWFSHRLRLKLRQDRPERIEPWRQRITVGIESFLYEPQQRGMFYVGEVKIRHSGYMGSRARRGGAIPLVYWADRSPRPDYHIVAARSQPSTKCRRVHRQGLTNVTKRGRLPLPRVRLHQLGECHAGRLVRGMDLNLIALGAVCASPG